jgi:PilX N-terminal
MNMQRTQGFHRPPRPLRGQRGIALFVGLVFLVVLSLVAVIAMQGTLMEMRMVTNVARHQEAFQVSEAGRTVLTAGGPQSLLAQNMVNRGWPESWGGAVPDSDFDQAGICAMPMSQWTATNCPAGWNFKSHLINGTDGTPKLLYGPLDSPGANGASIEDPAKPNTWVQDDVLTYNDPTVSGGQISTSLAMVPDGRGVNSGAGAAQAAGYRGLGVGLAGGGASLYFQIESVGLSPKDGSNGRAVTISQYKAVVQ